MQLKGLLGFLYHLLVSRYIRCIIGVTSLLKQGLNYIVLIPVETQVLKDEEKVSGCRDPLSALPMTRKSRGHPASVKIKGS
jgi:hypothetical protein